MFPGAIRRLIQVRAPKVRDSYGLLPTDWFFGWWPEKKLFGNCGLRLLWLLWGPYNKILLQFNPSLGDHVELWVLGPSSHVG